MYILGINGGLRHGYQDVSTVLVKDGKVVYGIAEERLNRIKHSAGQLPFLGIREALKFEGIDIRDVSWIATHGSTWGDDFEPILQEYITYTFGHCPKINRVHHHLAHAASTYYASGFDDAMILTMDASGDGISTQRAIGSKGEIEIIGQISRPNSLGIFYSIMTQYCGFFRDTDEYKLMGLAPYGSAEDIKLDEVLAVTDNGFELNRSFLKPIKPGAAQGTRQQPAFSDQLVQLLGPARISGRELTPHYKNVAAAAQKTLTEAIVALVTQFHQETGLRKLCLAGGVALNCEANRHLMQLDFLDDIFVQPASGDDGISLGAAWITSNMEGIPPVQPEDYYWGNSYTNADIHNQLTLLGVDFSRVNDPGQEAAKRVSQNQVLGWFQGRDEFGPRALGNRSILANPTHPEMKQILNQKIKFREGFRPFCPSILAESCGKYFTGKRLTSPYMTFNYEVNVPATLPTITHVNNTARIQTVDREQNPLYHEYLCALAQTMDIGMSVNTSFNRNNEPIVHTPIEAVSAFYGSGMDALIIGDFVLSKKSNLWS